MQSRTAESTGSLPTRQRDLLRSLSVKGVVSVSLSWVAPTLGVMFYATYVFQIGGTFTPVAIVAMGLISVIPTAMCLAKLGARFPSAGGVYRIARETLPGPSQWVMMLSSLVFGAAGLAVLSLSFAEFLKELVPLHAPNRLIALLALGLALAICLVRAKVGVRVTFMLICVELSVLGTVMMAAVLHAHQGVSALVTHPVYLSNGRLLPVTLSVALATFPLALALMSAYEAPLGYGEEIVGGSRALARAMNWTGVLTVLLMGGSVVAATIAAPNLIGFLGASSPAQYSVQRAFGSNWGNFITLGIVVALFTSLVGGIMYVGRMLYTTGQDGLWWRTANRKLASINRFGVPGWAVSTLVTLLTVPLVFWGILSWLVYFLTALVSIMYFLVGCATIAVRHKYPTQEQPLRMGWWLAPPVIVMIVMAVAFYYQERQYQIGAAVLILGGPGRLGYSTQGRWTYGPPRIGQVGPIARSACRGKVRLANTNPCQVSMS